MSTSGGASRILRLSLVNSLEGENGWHKFGEFGQRQKGKPSCNNRLQLGLEAMPKGRLELPCLAAPPPQDGVSTNSTTSAVCVYRVVASVASSRNGHASACQAGNNIQF